MGGIDLALIIWKWETFLNSRKLLSKVLESSKFGAETVRCLQTFAQVRAEMEPGQGEVFDLSEMVHQAAAEMTKPIWKTGPEKEGRRRIGLHESHGGCFVNGKRESDMLRCSSIS